MLFFFLTCILGCLIGRGIGWWLSRALLYTGPIVPVILFLFVWASGTAFLLGLAIDWLHPGIVLKVIGYGAGAYVSNPAFGLLQEDAIPLSQRDRHLPVNNLPILFYIATATAVAFFSHVNRGS